MRVFISYRRDDSKDVVGRIADRLQSTPGVAKIFMDVAAIQGGDDFLRAINTAIKKSQVALVVIGAEWATLKGGEGAPRISETNDTVAAEIRQALASGRRVIPVLVNGAKMPGAAQLPEAIAALSTLNAVPLRHETFESDFILLTNAMFNRKGASTIDAYFGRHPVQAVLARAVFGFAIAGILLGVGLLAARQFHILSGPLGGSREAAVFLSVVIVLSGALVSSLFGRTAKR